MDATNSDNPKIAISLIDPSTLSRVNLSIQGSELHGVPATINISETRTGGFLVTWGAFDNAQQTAPLWRSL